MIHSVKIIAIVGMPGAGKSVAAAFFKNKGIPVLRFGDQIEIGVYEKGWRLTPENERKVREELRRQLGMAVMAIKIEPRILDVIKTHTTVVLDGLYSWEEYIYLREKFPNIKLLCIYCAPPLRYKRLSERSIRPLTPKEARARDLAEIEKLNKGGPIALADYLINNDTTLGEFQSELEKALTEI